MRKRHLIDAGELTAPLPPVSKPPPGPPDFILGPRPFRKRRGDEEVALAPGPPENRPGKPFPPSQPPSRSNVCSNPFVYPTTPPRAGNSARSFTVRPPSKGTQVAPTPPRLEASGLKSRSIQLGRARPGYHADDTSGPKTTPVYARHSPTEPAKVPPTHYYAASPGPKLGPPATPYELPVGPLTSYRGAIPSHKIF